VLAVHCDPHPKYESLVRVGDRPVDALLANAGRAPGHAFFDQELKNLRCSHQCRRHGRLGIISAGPCGRAARAHPDHRPSPPSPRHLLALYNASKALLAFLFPSPAAVSSRIAASR